MKVYLCIKALVFKKILTFKYALNYLTVVTNLYWLTFIKYISTANDVFYYKFMQDTSIREQLRRNYRLQN